MVVRSMRRSDGRDGHMHEADAARAIEGSAVTLTCLVSFKVAALRLLQMRDSPALVSTVRQVREYAQVVTARHFVRSAELIGNAPIPGGGHA